ncbi:MAG TPA: ferritin [Desulfobulbaceae bacterium]|nr:ferritin [Desulfobulbaceae bacterium]
MDNKEIAKKLSSLVQLDIDAVHAYKEAIEKIDDLQVREHLTQYRQDHERHISDLSAEIRRLGGTPPEFSLDFKGYLIKGFTSLRSTTGTKGALNAMHTNEKLTNKEYEAAKYWDFPPDLKQMIALAREDERRHLEYIERALEEKPH